MKAIKIEKYCVTEVDEVDMEAGYVRADKDTYRRR